MRRALDKLAPLVQKLQRKKSFFKQGVSGEVGHDFVMMDGSLESHSIFEGGLCC